MKSSRARSGAVRSVRCQTNRTISPSPCAAAGSLLILWYSYVIYHPLHPFFPCLGWDLLPSNRGMHRVTLTSGTAGAGMHVGRCPLCVCHWACTDETSVPRGAVGNYVPSTEPGVSVTIWHISASRVHAHASTHGLFAHSPIQAQQPVSLLHSINHPSSNCPWLSCSLTICSSTTSPYKWQTTPSTTVFPGNQGVYQGPPWFLPAKSLKVGKGKGGHAAPCSVTTAGVWFSAPGNNTITTTQEGCTSEPQEATGAGQVYITSDSIAAITLPLFFAAETMNCGQPLFIETVASRQEQWILAGTSAQKLEKQSSHCNLTFSPSSSAFIPALILLTFPRLYCRSLEEENRNSDEDYLSVSFRSGPINSWRGNKVLPSRSL